MAYGASTLSELSRQLTARFGRGFSRPNLVNMRKFYLLYPNCQTVSDILTWSHISELIKAEDYRNEYISLTDIARYRNSDDPRFAIQNWMRNRNTIEFLGLWESLHNPSFNRVQFDTFKTEAGLNRFIMTPSKWIEQTGAIGITSSAHGNRPYCV